MALLTILQPDATTKLGIWKIEESEEHILSLYPHLENAVAERFRHPARRLEKLSAYLLLYAMQPDHLLLIGHNAEGKPLLDGWEISLSDTRGYVAIILSKGSKRVGVDIEYMSNRVEKIASRFIRADEDSSSTPIQLINWSAKETVFKYFSEQHLAYNDMRLHPFVPAEEGVVEVDNLKEGTSVNVHYQMNEAFVITYSY